MHQKSYSAGMGWVSVVGSQNYKTCDVDDINIFLNFNNLVQRWEVGGWLNPEPDEFRYLMHFYLFTFTFFFAIQKASRPMILMKRILHTTI